MAKYIKAHSELADISKCLASDVEKLDRMFLSKFPTETVPAHVLKCIQDVKSHLGSALIQCTNAARMLIEAEVDEGLKPKED